MPSTSTSETWYPVLDVMVNVVDDPWLTRALVGLMLPPDPADVETVYWFRVNAADTVHGPLIGFVV